MHVYNETDAHPLVHGASQFKWIWAGVSEMDSDALVRDNRTLIHLTNIVLNCNQSLSPSELREDVISWAKRDRFVGQQRSS